MRRAAGEQHRAFASDSGVIGTVPLMTMRTVAAALLAVALVGPLAGCSNRQAAPNRRGHTGSATASVENGVQQVTLVVDDKYRFDPSTIKIGRASCRERV